MRIANQSRSTQLQLSRVQKRELTEIPTYLKLEREKMKGSMEVTPISSPEDLRRRGGNPRKTNVNCYLYFLIQKP